MNIRISKIEFCTLMLQTQSIWKLNTPLQLTFHRGTLGPCSWHHYHPHTGPSPVREVLWAVLLTHHLHKGTALLHVLWWLHGSVLLSRLPFSWPAVRKRNIHSDYLAVGTLVQGSPACGWFKCLLLYQVVNTWTLKTFSPCHNINHSRLGSIIFLCLK